jgi:alkylation response protein AidB-like acyl-CoA dehydrogenase
VIAEGLDPTLLVLGECDRRGVPRVGRPAELAALRTVGARNASLGRIFEGHLNASQLIARCGTPVQKARAEHDARRGLVFGVWNTQEGDGVRIQTVAQGDQFILAGAKTWASGAGTIERPIVTAAWPDGSLQMCLVPMDRVDVTIDRSTWRPLGMLDSDSFRVAFDGVTLTPEALIGKPGDYERNPWFHGGALRFAAVHTGIAERLYDETVAFLLEHGRDGDPFQRSRVAEMRIAVETARHWIDAGERAWSAFDRSETPAAAEHVVDVVDMVRTVVERACLDVLERAIRSVGARGLVEPLPFASLVRDLQMYLRQPAPDAACMRVAERAFSCAIAARNATVAHSTGTGS